MAKLLVITCLAFGAVVAPAAGYSLARAAYGGLLPVSCTIFCTFGPLSVLLHLQCTRMKEERINERKNKSKKSK